jgi:hypothetical protein
MRGIERLVAGALLVMAVTGTAVLARTSAPGGTHAQAVRLQSPPRSHLVAPLPVVVAVPEVPARLVVPHPATPPFRTTVAFAKPVEVPVVAPAAPASPPDAPAAPTPASPPAAPSPAPAPAPTPAPTSAPATRVIAAAQRVPATTTTKTFGHSHPRGHAWGHLKHAVTTLAAGDPPGDDDSQAQEPAPAPVPPVTAPPASDDGNGNGNGHAWGHSKNGNGD